MSRVSLPAGSKQKRSITTPHHHQLMSKNSRYLGSVHESNGLQQSTRADLATLLDLFFLSLARTPTGDVTEAILEKLQKCITVVAVKWRDLRLSTWMPKVAAQLVVCQAK